MYFGKIIKSLPEYSYGSKDYIINLINSGKSTIVDNKGNTPLHLAVILGDYHLVQFLLEQNVPLEVQEHTHDRLTPLGLAIYYNNELLVDLLISYGARLDPINNYGQTPLHLAILNGNANIVVFLLRYSHELNINAQDKIYDTPLHLPIKTSEKNCRKNFGIVKLLLNHNANMNKTNAKGYTPLHIATIVGCINLLTILIGYGANIHINTLKGNTPLHLALIELKRNQDYDINIIKILLKTDIYHSANYKKHTPLDIAKKTRNAQVIKLFK